MSSVSRSTGRLIWALSLLGFDRLVSMLEARSCWDREHPNEIERSSRVFDDLADRIRDLVSPGIRSMFETGERILDRFFAEDDGWHDSSQATIWPFPTDPGDDGSMHGRHGSGAHGFEASETWPGEPGPFPIDSHLDEAPPSGVPEVDTGHAAARSRPGGEGPALDDPQSNPWQPAPAIPDIVTYFETGKRPKTASPTEDRGPGEDPAR